MNPLSTPLGGETVADAGERIRAACPIRGATATDEECRDRRELIDDTLHARGIKPGVHCWRTAQLVDGHVVGVFADSDDEAELDLTVWWGQACHWVIPDPYCRVFHEYFPNGKSSGRIADNRFELGSPRHPRDKFAPTQSLLEDIWAPPASDHPGIG